jgi:hypothetical protein
VCRSLILNRPSLVGRHSLTSAQFSRVWLLPGDERSLNGVLAVRDGERSLKGVQLVLGWWRLVGGCERFLREVGNLGAVQCADLSGCEREGTGQCG